MKNLKNTLALIALALITLFTSSCSNEDNGFSGSRAAIEMKAVRSNGTTARTAISGLVFTEVMVGVTELEFETLEENELENDEGEDDSEEIEFRGAFQVDLLADTSTPNFGFAELESGVYEEVEIEFGNVLPSGNTISIKLSFQDAQNQTQYVEFSTTEEFELEIENDMGFTFSDGVKTKVMVTLNLDALFASIDFSTLQKSESGVIVINENSNTEAMGAIVEALETAFEAEEDKDDDDDDEIDD